MRLKGVRVLVADDDADSLRSVADALERVGASVVRVENGAEMIDKMAHEGRFGLIVTDVGMPWVNGVQAMRAARHAGIRTPVIVMSALADERIPVDVEALGANAALLRKPFDLESLETLAAQLCAVRS